MIDYCGEEFGTRKEAVAYLEVLKFITQDGRKSTKTITLASSEEGNNKPIVKCEEACFAVGYYHREKFSLFCIIRITTY
jgi:hypothetical protein